MPGDACTQIQPELLEVKPKTSSFSALSQGGGRAEAKVERNSKEPQSTSCVLPEPFEAPPRLLPTEQPSEGCPIASTSGSK